MKGKMFLSSLHSQTDNKKMKKENDKKGLLASRSEFHLNSMKKNKQRKLKGKAQTKFEEFLEMEKANSVFSADEDAKTLKRLTKRLKVKNGLLDGDDDGYNLLLEGLPSGLDMFFDESAIDHMEEDAGEKSLKEEAVPSNERSKKRKKRKKIRNDLEMSLREDNTRESDKGVSEKHNELPEEEACVRLLPLDATVKYVAPHMRASQDGESEELSQVHRRIRGLLNKLSESNVESITGEVAAIFRTIGRSVACQIIGDEVMASCSRGPRGNEQLRPFYALFQE